jgi:hypothetical protein
MVAPIEIDHQRQRAEAEPDDVAEGDAQSQ